MTPGKKDIHAAGPECFNWNGADPTKSLQDLRTFVEEEAQKTINWYLSQKNSKRRPSQAIQFLALALTALAGLAPIAAQILKNSGRLADRFDSGPMASLLVGLAAALIGLDKAFGYSSGWIRYVLTSTSMTKVLQEFRMEWVLLYAASAAPPTSEQQAALIQRAKEFVSAIQSALLQETKDWATEFQSTLSQVERDVKAQLDALKAKVEKVAAEREQASKPAGIELTVPNADRADGFETTVVMESKAGSQSEALRNSKVWTRIDVPPGMYRLALNAAVGGKPASVSTVVEVKPGEIAKVSLSLPV